LYEQQFIDAVREAEKSTGMKTKFFIGFADISISGYHFYYEFENQDTTIEQANEFTKVVDDNLNKANLEYQAKRDSFRLKDPISHLLEDNSFEKFKEATLKITGADASRFKPNVLMQNDEKHELMKRFEKK
ncbi:MAG: GH3 auxin-responsive promoter family protein, partial [Bacteroidales bacterium]|nr:GH3 auxin-responsive promoter family protein [Bacteroidales bacterium]